MGLSSIAASLENNADRGLKVVEHAEEGAGYKADLARFLDQHFAIAPLCKVANIAPGMLTRKIADIYLSNVCAADGAARKGLGRLPTP